MAKKRQSELAELLTLLRRIVVLAVAAWGLAREFSLDALAGRLVLLWAVLYVISGFTEVLFQFLAQKAHVRHEADSRSMVSTATTPSAATSVAD